MSVTRDTKSILFLLLRRCREWKAGSFLSVPRVRSRPVGGGQRGQVEPGGARSPRLAGTFRGPTPGPQTRILRAARRPLQWRCLAGAGLVEPIDFLRLRSSFESSLRDLGFSGRAPPPRVLWEPRLSVLMSDAGVRSLGGFSAFPHARLIAA